MAEARITHQPVHTDRPHVTLEDFFEAGIDQIVEVIDGELVVMTPQVLRSTQIAHHLYDSLWPFVKEKTLGRVYMELAFAPDVDRKQSWVYGARVPDVSFISRQRLEAALAEQGDNEPLYVAPDLAVEIVSPSDKYTAVNRKVSDYLRYGVRLIWVVDPQMRTVRVVTSDKPEGSILTDQDTLTGDPVLSGWSMRVADLLEVER